jgi:hypothetical protein
MDEVLGTHNLTITLQVSDDDKVLEPYRPPELRNKIHHGVTIRFLILNPLVESLASIACDFTIQEGQLLRGWKRSASFAGKFTCRSHIGAKRPRAWFEPASGSYGPSC